jgi:hypothetical protein
MQQGRLELTDNPQAAYSARSSTIRSIGLRTMLKATYHRFWLLRYSRMLEDRSGCTGLPECLCGWSRSASKSKRGSIGPPDTGAVVVKDDRRVDRSIRFCATDASADLRIRHMIDAGSVTPALEEKGDALQLPPPCGSTEKHLVRRRTLFTFWGYYLTLIKSG